MQRSFPTYRVRHLAVATLVVLAAPLGGCGEARKAIGWDKNPPDEFRILTRAPLAVPPDFGLRPPAPGAPRPQEGTTTDQARNALTGGRAAPRGAGDPAGSVGVAALLQRAGADRADPQIRGVVDRESKALADAERSFADRLIFWRSPDPPGVVVDAEREQQRLRENQALGLPSTEGESPIVRRRQRGFLEGLF